jgi:hypothetical protein
MLMAGLAIYFVFCFVVASIIYVALALSSSKHEAKLYQELKSIIEEHNSFTKDLQQNRLVDFHITAKTQAAKKQLPCFVVSPTPSEPEPNHPLIYGWTQTRHNPKHIS